jgi:hypothetical protein
VEDRVAVMGKALMERELEVDDELGVAELFEQIATKVEFADVLYGHQPLTPRRFVEVVFDIVRARRRNALRPYPERTINAVAWLLVRAH